MSTSVAPAPLPETRGMPATGGWRRTLASIGIVLAAVAVSAALRIHTALTDPNFDCHDARPMLRSDPALLYYITERIIEGGGLPPADFRADPRVEYPDTCDLPATFTVGQEFLVAWSYLLLDRRIPLHVLCIWAMGICASLAAVGVYGSALELTRSVRWAALAVTGYLVLPANYRTIGFILIREDLSVPCLALHLFFAVRAARTRRWHDYALTAATLILAVSTWHAMAFIVAIEAACVFAWYLRAGHNPLAARWAWLIPALAMPASLTVPVLRGRSFLLSLPMLCMAALLVAAVLGSAGRRLRALSRPVAAVALVVAVLVPVVFAPASGQSHYSHVFALVKEKILRLGVLPADPTTIPFEVRLLWDGPFATADVGTMLGAFGVTIVVPFIACAVGGRGWVAPRGNPVVMVLLAFTVAATVSGYFVARTVVLAGLLIPVAGVILLGQLHPPLLRLRVGAIALMVQVLLFGLWLGQHRITWYTPPSRNVELARLIEWVGQNVPPTEPIAADFVTSPALLAHTRNPVLLQPKYETTRSRRRIEEFLMTFAHGTPHDFRALVKRYQCKYVVIDPFYLWDHFQYATGTPRGREGPPTPGTAADALCSPRPRTRLPGFRLLYPSEPVPERSLYRVYAIE
ncbi:MAG: hypothetical protein V2A79_06325 [Planctomycetota bacterium]